MDIKTAEKKIKADRAVLDQSIEDGASGEEIKENFEKLIESFSQKLVLDLKKISEETKGVSEEEIEKMQSIEVEKFKEKIVDIAHFIDNSIKE